MAIRRIIKIGDETLSKKCRPVTDFNARLATLLDDMAETLHEANGVGLAAPQVGILKRAVVIDVGEGIIELINPKIVSSSEETTNDYEGCLSVPEKWGYVERPQTVTVKAEDRSGNPFELTGEGLLARAICHELDHLDGHLFTEKVSEYVDLSET
ncbi:MAG: peptide deformylase [Clostridiales bacterium]|jgi:peptide deformylase|nr:peptide deformylase [Clostridiales bacterium]